MTKFFNARLARHQKKMMKYMRYVLNDHFVLVCLFLVGGLGFYYSNLLKSLPENFVWGLPIVALIWWLVLPAGGLATLLEPADTAFLLPKEKQMAGYLDRAVQHSLLFPFVLEGLVVGITLPLVVVIKKESFAWALAYLGLVWLLKVGHFLLLRFSAFQDTKSKVRQLLLFWAVVSLVAIAASLYVTPVIGLALALFLLLILRQVTKTTRLLDWQKLIDQERSRLYRIYQFINLFTDVPEIEAKVKRRKYLDGVLHLISFKQSNTYLYLFSRRALRGSEYSGLYFRLLVVGCVLLLTLRDVRFIAILAALFIYLIGFQMLPLYTQFDYVSLTQLFPVSTPFKRRALRQLIGALLVIASVIFALASLAVVTPLESLLIFVILLIEIGLFLILYVPSRIKKMER
ncbi:ABC transporter permease [Enterococcus sp. CSURQ0835]|uniref:ABC transporter permease n=1 Tax=Enterococcus sp. CSURQ0835 TaxID=2681394 RepID=UPI001356B030|nr:ABC transporter permease [Enterococcus sp. CSURQ0835]